MRPQKLRIKLELRRFSYSCLVLEGKKRGHEQKDCGLVDDDDDLPKNVQGMMYGTVEYSISRLLSWRECSAQCVYVKKNLGSKDMYIAK